MAMPEQRHHYLWNRFVSNLITCLSRCAAGINGVMAGCGGDEQLNGCLGAVVEHVCHFAGQLPRARSSVGHLAASHGRFARGSLRSSENQQRRRDIELSFRPTCSRRCSELRKLHSFLARHGSHFTDSWVGAQVTYKYRSRVSGQAI